MTFSCHQTQHLALHLSHSQCFLVCCHRSYIRTGDVTRHEDEISQRRYYFVLRQFRREATPFRREATSFRREATKL